MTNEGDASERDEAEPHVGDESRDEDGVLRLGRKRDVGLCPFVDWVGVTGEGGGWVGGETG